MRQVRRGAFDAGIESGMRTGPLDQPGPAAGPEECEFMNRPLIKAYKVKTEKLAGPVRFVLLSDLHSRIYKEGNRGLIDLVRNMHPDIILCAGDMLVGKPRLSYQTAADFLCALPGIAPVFFSNGNHETQYRTFSRSRYGNYLMSIREAGVCVLNNARTELETPGGPADVAGLELPLGKYKKFRKHDLREDDIKERIGERADDGRFQILIAHNPEFAETYRKWGADLIVSGHYHGGVVRSPFTGHALLSPYGYPFPKYGYGHYTWDPFGNVRCDTVGEKGFLPRANENVSEGVRSSFPGTETGDVHLIISGGLGDHSVPLRIFNPREIVCIDAVRG